MNNASVYFNINNELRLSSNEFDLKKSQNSYINEFYIHQYTSEHSLCIKCKVSDYKSVQCNNSSFFRKEQEFLYRVMTSANVTAINANAEYLYIEKQDQKFQGENMKHRIDLREKTFTDEREENIMIFLN